MAIPLFLLENPVTSGKKAENSGYLPVTVKTWKWAGNGVCERFPKVLRSMCSASAGFWTGSLRPMFSPHAGEVNGFSFICARKPGYFR